MRRLVVIACVLLGLVLVGCSGDPTASDEYQTLESEYDALAGELNGVDQMRQQLFYERNDLEAANEALEQELEAVIAERDAITAVDPSEACTDKLARCEEMLSPPDDGEEWPVSSPAVWSPSYTGYRTVEATLMAVVYAPDAATVTVNGVDAGTDRSPYFFVEVPLVEGDNVLEVVVGDDTMQVLVVRDSNLERRYGRVLDAHAEWDAEKGTDWFLGIDYGDMDLEPDYGAGDFDPGDVIVEFGELTAATPLIINSAFSSKVILTSPRAIVDYFWYESPPTDVWNVLLDGDTIIQIEGPMPLGD